MTFPSAYTVGPWLTRRPTCPPDRPRSASWSRYVRAVGWWRRSRRPPRESARVSLACADDDAQGQTLEVYWDFEIDRRILAQEAWADLGADGFDPPRHFSAFLHTLRWNCVTSTDPNLFQAPFRAGIKIDAYQMEPLRKALRLPRVNLFIADDTGLGKTIKAGLIARELLLRKRARTVVVAAPASVMEQWKAEMEERFGLLFVILDRSYLAQVRREHGFGVNPWRTHSRFIVSHNLLIDATYADPMREWLGSLSPGSLLILDEAHHAAPSSGGKYGIETRFTRAVRDLGGRFEHRLFLSATPHNGHSNSFATLLELLDPYRFTRGVPVRGKGALEHVMVRRLKEDIREVQGGFPRREVCRVVIDGLPDDAPELVLSRLLDEYRGVREARFQDVTARTKAAAGLLVVGLQQKLLSSIEAFAISLARHRSTAREQWERFASTDRQAETPGSGAFAARAASRFAAPPDADDERAEQTDEENAAEEAAQIVAVNTATESASDRSAEAEALWRREQELLDRMERVAAAARGHPDAKTRALIRWIDNHLCPDRPRWNVRRVLIFTENVIGTKRYLREMLEQAIAGTDRADERIETIDGREPQGDPAPLQREPGGRSATHSDRHRCRPRGTELPGALHRPVPLRPALESGPDRAAQRTHRPQAAARAGGALPLLRAPAARRGPGAGSAGQEDANHQARARQPVQGDRRRHRTPVARRHPSPGRAAPCRRDRSRRPGPGEEARCHRGSEAARERQEDLKEQIERCRGLLERSRRWVDFRAKPFRDAMSCSLELLRAEPLREERTEDDSAVWTFPPMTGQTLADASWTSTLDTLRVPRGRGQKLAEWRRTAPIRPVVFEDAGVLTDETVHLHLEQRMAQRLLARFRAQGFVYHDLSRACLVQAADSIPRVILLGRLCLHGRRAERLHEILTPVAARWIEPLRRTEPLRAYAGEAESRTLQRLESALQHAHTPSETIHRRLLQTAAQDIADLLPQLEERAKLVARTASGTLRDRGESEARQLRMTLERQRQRVETELARHEAAEAQLRLDFSDEEKRQRQADVAAWRRRLTQFDRELETEPSRIRQFYEVRARRIEPVGLVYLWPDTG